MTKNTFVDIYRPATFEEFVGQEKIVYSIKNKIKRNRLGDMLFLSYKPGTGKTSLAIIIARELFGNEWRSRLHMFNASDDRGINFVRDEINRVSSWKGMKIIFLDEADNMTIDAQQAMRGIMEKKTDTIFILTGNYEHKIIDPIKSRCSVYRFTPLEDKDILKKLITICKIEKINITNDAKEGLKRLTRYVNGDLRQAIKTLDDIIDSDNEITTESVALLEKNNEAIKTIIKTALAGNFNDAKQSIEKQYILQKFSYSKLSKQIFEVLDEIEDLEEIEKVFLYDKLADFEFRVKMGSNPHVQLIKLIAQCYKVKHYPR